jgi:hypothetical protein
LIDSVDLFPEFNGVFVEIGKKFRLRSDFPLVAEIIGIFPAGQGDRKEAEFQLMLDSEKLILPKRLIDLLFQEYVHEDLKKEDEPSSEDSASIEPKKVRKKGVSNG